jgi:hypothetical protein
MTLPTNASKANLDSATDDPKLARPDLADLVDKFNDLLTHLNLSTITSGPASIPLSLANGGTGAATAAAARTNLGVEDATESAAGRIEIATQTESNNGTDDTRALTPLKLASISPASVTYSTSDQILILDASDSNKLKRATVTTGKVLQVVNTTSSAVATNTTAMPYDDTIPQNTEGAELMTATITPSNSSNKLRIDVTVFCASSFGDMVVALFQDSTANALAAGGHDIINRANAMIEISFSHYMTAGTTSATTFKVRGGQSNAGSTFTFNGDNGARLFGGVMSSSITVTEIAA